MIVVDRECLIQTAVSSRPLHMVRGRAGSIASCLASCDNEASEDRLIPGIVGSVD